MTPSQGDQEAIEWQIGIWNRISDVYVREIDQRFTPVVEAVLKRAELKAGESVLDLGTGTCAVAERAAAAVGGFDFPNFAAAWEALALVTAAHLPLDQQEEAQQAVKAVMYPTGDEPRHFTNLTQFIIGRASGQARAQER